jgi:TonB family protein
MSYRYLKKGKKLSSDEIKSKMNFEKVLEDSAILEVTELPRDAFSSDRKNGKYLLWFALPVLILLVYLALPKTENSTVREIIDPELKSPPSTTIEYSDSISDTTQPVELEKGKLKQTLQDDNQIVVQEPAKKKVIPLAKQPNSNEKDSYKDQVEKEDIFVGAKPKMGFDQFYAFIDEQLTYPESAKSNILEGYVKVRFAVSPEGKISDFEIQETLGEAFDKEAMRVLNLVGDWLPATFNDEPVKSQFSIKMRFKLNN